MLASALKHLVTGIVEHPDDVQVDSSSSARGEVLEVRVHPEDLGRVIGRAGRTAKALRTLVNALADGRRVRVDVVDTDEDLLAMSQQAVDLVPEDAGGLRARVLANPVEGPVRAPASRSSESGA